MEGRTVCLGLDVAGERRGEEKTQGEEACDARHGGMRPTSALEETLL